MPNRWRAPLIMAMIALHLTRADATDADLQIVAKGQTMSAAAIRRIAPADSALSAALAYQALVAATGCNDGECRLTSALGLQTQCSSKQLALVARWFGSTGLDALGRGPASQETDQSRRWAALCESRDDGASAQQSWFELELRRRGDRLLFRGLIRSPNFREALGEDFNGEYQVYELVVEDRFLIRPATIEVISHQVRSRPRED